MAATGAGGGGRRHRAPAAPGAGNGPQRRPDPGGRPFPRRRGQGAGTAAQLRLRTKNDAGLVPPHSFSLSPSRNSASRREESRARRAERDPAGADPPPRPAPRSPAGRGPTRPAAGEVGPKGSPLEESEPRSDARPHRATRKAPDVLEETATRRGGRGPDTGAPRAGAARSAARRQRDEGAPSVTRGTGSFPPSAPHPNSVPLSLAPLSAQLRSHRRPALLAAGTHGASLPGSGAGTGTSRGWKDT